MRVARLLLTVSVLAATACERAVVSPSAPAATASVAVTAAPSVAASFGPSAGRATLVPASSPVANVTLPLPQPDAGTYGRPWTRNGEIVPYNVLRLDRGPGHCDWQDITFLTMHKNLGQPTLMADDGYGYVRDPENRWAREPIPPDEFMTLGRFEPSVSKPRDAVFTGYVYFDGMELWRSESATIDFVFLRRGDIWEQWPRSRSPIACV